MTATDVSGDVIVREVYIEASQDTVFAFFTDPDKMTRWMGTTATLEPEQGGLLSRRHCEGDGRQGRIQGSVAELSNLVQLRLGFGGYGRAPGLIARRNRLRAQGSRHALAPHPFRFAGTSRRPAHGGMDSLLWPTASGR